MHVRLEREGGRVVAEPRLHLLDVAAFAEERCRARVSEAVEAEPRDVGGDRSGFEVVGEMPRVQPRACRAREDELAVGCVRLLAMLPQQTGELGREP
jgi:hypothetical protein